VKAWPSCAPQLLIGAQLASVLACGSSATSTDGNVQGGTAGTLAATATSTGYAGSQNAGSQNAGSQNAGPQNAGPQNAGGAATGRSTNDITGGASATVSTSGRSTSGPNVLVFSRTAGYRHASIEPGIQALEKLAREHQFSVTATEDPSVFSASGLSPYAVVLFLSTTGDVLDAAQQLAFEAFIRMGRGYVGIHAASDTEYDWPWYGGLVGAYFRDHPEVQTATIQVENANHPATAHLATTWTRNDEWYAFRENPRGNVEVLLCLDESTYKHDIGSMGSDHPIAWYHDYDGGRAFYTALGHTEESFQEPAFLDHIWGGIRWAAKL
jgi:type 1 glutamine amidotransferase